MPVGGADLRRLRLTGLAIPALRCQQTAGRPPLRVGSLLPGTGGRVAYTICWSQAGPRMPLEPSSQRCAACRSLA